MKKIVSLVLALMLVVCVFAGCSNKSENAVTVTVNFEAEGSQFYSKEVTVYADDPKVITAVQTLMDENDDIEIVVEEFFGSLTVASVNDYANDDSAMWEFKVNNKDYSEMSGRADTNSIKNGDVITWGYIVSSEDAETEEISAE